MLSSRVIYISLLILYASGTSRSQDPLANIDGFLPLSVGDRWIYDTEFRDGAGADLEVQHWLQEDTTIAVEWIPEGVLIRRKVSFLQATTPPARFRVSEESNILVHGACVYYLQDSFSNHLPGWNSTRGDLSLAFRKALDNGEALPDACFPLRQGQTWTVPNMRERTWTVAGFGPKNPDDPISATAQSWRLEASLASGDENLVWFQKGVGVIARRTLHHGSYHDERVRLLRFEPAGPAR